MKDLIVLGGTYSNKGGLAIVKGTLKIFRDLGINVKCIVDPEPSFPDDFFKNYKITPIYRWSYTLKDKRTMQNLIKSFILCLKNSYSHQIRELKNLPIWYIGDSSLNDHRSVLSLFGQIVNLLSLKFVINGQLLINASMGYTRTKIGKKTLQLFLKYADHFFVRGYSSYYNLIRLGVPSKRITIICDFAFYLDKVRTIRSKEYLKLINESEISIALIFKHPPKSINKVSYIHTIKKLISKLKEQKYTCFLLPTSYSSDIMENDLIFLQENFNAYNDIYIININKLMPEEIIDVFSSFDAVITTRLHGAVFSTLAGVPTYHIYEAHNSLDVIKDMFGKLVPLVHIAEFSKGNNLSQMIKDIEILIRRRDEISNQILDIIELKRRQSKDKLKIVLDELL